MQKYLWIGIAALVVVFGAIFVLSGHTQTPEPKPTATSSESAPQNELTSEAPTDGASSPSNTETANIPVNAALSKTYTLADVAAHATPEDCWTAVAGAVYDLTQAINKHPGGPEAIERICGKDGTAMFEGKHGDQEKPQEILATLKIGTLAQ